FPEESGIADVVGLQEERDLVVTIEDRRLAVRERIVERDAEPIERRRQSQELLLVVELESEDLARIGIVGGHQDQLAELTSFEHFVFQFREARKDRLVDVLVENTGGEYAAGLEVPLQREV